jgi:WD40 repeat protein
MTADISSLVIDGPQDETIRVWDVSTGYVILTVQGALAYASLAITTDNSKIVSGSRNKTIKVWDFSENAIQQITLTQ